MSYLPQMFPKSLQPLQLSCSDSPSAGVRLGRNVTVQCLQVAATDVQEFWDTHTSFAHLLIKHSTLRIYDAGCPASQERFPPSPLLLHDPAEFSWTFVTTVISTWVGGDHEVPHFITYKDVLGQFW